LGVVGEETEARRTGYVCAVLSWQERGRARRGEGEAAHLAWARHGEARNG
jgi:hypothetical protein